MASKETKMAEKSELGDESICDEPNYAVICSFLTRYGALLGLPDVSFSELEKWIDDTRYLDSSLQDIMLRLLKRWKAAANEDKFAQYLIRFAHTYSQVDAWELEEFGFQRCKLSTKLRILKNLLEQQFDSHTKFKEKINEIPASDLRWLPIGRDISGRAYWYLIDNNLTVRVYREEQDDVENESWQIVVSDRDQLAELIASLQEQKASCVEKSCSPSPSTLCSEENTQSSDVLSIKHDGPSEDKIISTKNSHQDDSTELLSTHKTDTVSDEKISLSSHSKNEINYLKREVESDDQQNKVEKSDLDVIVKQEEVDPEDNKSLKSIEKEEKNKKLSAEEVSKSLKSLRKEVKCRKLSEDETLETSGISRPSCLAKTVVNDRVGTDETVCDDNQSINQSNLTKVSESSASASGVSTDIVSSIEETSFKAVKESSSLIDNTKTSKLPESERDAGIFSEAISSTVSSNETLSQARKFSENSFNVCAERGNNSSKITDENKAVSYSNSSTDKSNDNSTLLKNALPVTKENEADEIINRSDNDGVDELKTSRSVEALEVIDKEPIEYRASELLGKPVKESSVVNNLSESASSLEPNENHGESKSPDIDKESVISSRLGVSVSKASDSGKENLSVKEAEESSPKSDAYKSRSPKQIIKPCRRIKLNASSSESKIDSEVKEIAISQESKEVANQSKCTKSSDVEDDETLQGKRALQDEATSLESKASSEPQDVVTPADSKAKSTLRDMVTPPKSKKSSVASPPKSTTNSEGQDVRTSVKRKRDEVLRCSSSSSEPESGQSESELSETTSDGVVVEDEIEPPSKRKRDKALLTASQRDRRSGRNKSIASPSNDANNQSKIVTDDAVAKDDDTKDYVPPEAVTKGTVTPNVVTPDVVAPDIDTKDTGTSENPVSKDCQSEVTESLPLAKKSEAVELSSSANDEVVQKNSYNKAVEEESQSAVELVGTNKLKQTKKTSEEKALAKQTANIEESSKVKTDLDDIEAGDSCSKTNDDLVDSGDKKSKSVCYEKKSAKNATESQNNDSNREDKAPDNADKLARKMSDKTSAKKEQNCSDSSKEQDESTTGGGLNENSLKNKSERNQKKRLHITGQKNVAVTEGEPDYEPNSKIGRAFGDKMADAEDDLEKTAEDEASPKTQTRGEFRRRGSSRGKRRGRPARCESKTARDVSTENKESTTMGDLQNKPATDSTELEQSKKSAAKKSDKKQNDDDNGNISNKNGDDMLNKNNDKLHKNDDVANDVSEKKESAENEGAQVSKEAGAKRRGRKKQLDVLLNDSAFFTNSNCEASCDSNALFEPRRSSRANKGQRKFVVMVEEPKRKRKTNSQIEEEPEEESVVGDDELKKSKKKRRGRDLEDEDFVPGASLRKVKSSRRARKGRRGKNASDTEQDNDEEEEDEDYYEDEEESLQFLSPSSSEDELESDGSMYEPSGRNAKRAAAIKQKVAEVVENDQPCCRCGKTEQPEWILLCDRCDAGYHTACLRPPLMVIPEGEWFCPPCEHIALIEKLQEQLLDYDKNAKQNVRLTQRKERLAFVGISLSNILPEDQEKAMRSLPDDVFDQELDNKSESNNSVSESDKSSDTDAERGSNSSGGGGRIRRRRRENERKRGNERKRERKYESSCTSDGPSRAKGRHRRSLSNEESSEEEEFETFRRSHRRRRDISYKFEEYEQLITTAIKDDMIEDEAEAEEAAAEDASVQQDESAKVVPQKCAPVRRVSKGKDMSTILGVSDSEDKPVKKSRKRGRRLNNLESDEDDDGDESEEYKISGDEASSATADEEYQVDDDEDTDDWCVQNSPVWGRGRKKKSTTRGRKTRRSRRNRSRYDSSGTDEEDSDESFRPPQRSVTRKRINYQENSDEDDDDDDEIKPIKSDIDSSPDVKKSAPWSKSSRRAMKQKRKGRSAKSDSDYEPDTDGAQKRSGRRDMKASRWQSSSSSEEKSDNDSDNIEEYDDEDSIAKRKKSKKEVSQNGLNKDRLKNFVFDSSDSSESSQKLVKKNTEPLPKKDVISKSSTQQRVTKKRVNVVAESETEDDDICAHDPAASKSNTTSTADSKTSSLDNKISAPSPDSDSKSPTRCDKSKDRDRKSSGIKGAKTRRTEDTTNLPKNSNVENNGKNHKLNGNTEDTQTVSASFTIDNILTKSPASRPVKRRHFDTQSGEESDSGSIGAQEESLKDVEDLVDYINQT